MSALLSVRCANCLQLAATCAQALTSRSYGRRTAITGTAPLNLMYACVFADTAAAQTGADIAFKSSCRCHFRQMIIHTMPDGSNPSHGAPASTVRRFKPVPVQKAPCAYMPQQASEPSPKVDTRPSSSEPV